MENNAQKFLNYIRKIPRNLYYALSPTHRLLLRRIIYFPVDAFEHISGRRHPLHPPHGLIFTGRGDFIRTGRHFSELLRLHAGLHSGSYVLDIGSGIGRLAVGLTEVLDNTGRYEGFDIVETGVKWCTQHITSKYPNFRFTHIPLHNNLYNTHSTDTSDTIQFPYPENHFDVAVATSVFTHMLYKDVKHYLSEISRTLKSGGRAMITFFCIDSVSELYMNKGEIRFPHRHAECYIMHIHVPEANVAYRHETIMNLFKDVDLNVSHVIPGRWSGASEYQHSTEFQDTFFVEKRAETY